RLVPAAAADRLRKYADSLRNSTSNSASSYSDFGNSSTAHPRYSDLW
ncbi:DUF2570 domain-containing protein, partial [Salmonella enterica subsp. enterica serovar Johannesburg]|nr:DUF2570 domain-containing protein [Salmonella enterica]EAN1043163.1 DUF2570 domain-containing protein [Salmonella enterica subsp. enterica serovar Johannesburg]EBF8698257.1 DUF2570 domain-containing protein [Salmonella enterica subsp. enterica]ECT5580710.1 DUF2570 domain-containing protein [Salmonella enterica subsp. enterica serovar Uganda]EAN8851588.1 DUF2570 domain-containing protein [Salmonella enterica subsp. enterica serovar Johannesburg]